jgi:hypothetical protein
MSRTCRMIMDVDPGIDDCMAIFYAVRREGIRLEALTTTFGNTDTAIATDNTLRVLELLRRSDIPVAMGVGRSFINPLRSPCRSCSRLKCDRGRQASGTKDSCNGRACKRSFHPHGERESGRNHNLFGRTCHQPRIGSRQGAGDRQALLQDCHHGIEDFSSRHTRASSADGRC